MVEAHKYMFDVDFTPPRQRSPDVVKDRDESVVEPEAPPPAPAVMFSEEELGLARDGAFDEGRQSGYAAGLEAGGVQIAKSLEALVAALPNLASVQTRANDLVLQDAIRLTQAVLRRAFPAIAESHAFDEVAKVVSDLIPHLLDEPRIIVRVALPLVETIRERLEQIAHSTGFEGRMVVQEDPRLKPGDCKVEWADGGAERDLTRLLAEAEHIIDRALTQASPSGEQAGTIQQEKING